MNDARSEPGAVHGAPSTLGRVARLAHKELSEILRDRRTIVTLVAMPLLLYPLLSVAFQQFFLASRLNPARTPEYRLGFESKEAAELFLARLEYGKEIIRQRAMRQAAAGKNVTAESAAPQIKPLFGAPEELDAALRAGEIDLLLRMPQLKGRLTPEHDWFFGVEAVYTANSAPALGALSYIEQRLAAADRFDLRQRFDLPGLKHHTIVLSMIQAPLEATGRDSLLSLPALVPLILILMTITGAVYPAIDLTAGERERGTLEVLVAAPVPRFALLSAKYIAVVTVAVLTALVNGVAMTFTLLASGLGPLLFGSGAGALHLVFLFGLLLLFAAFFSAVLLCLTSFARSFKEAQAYLIPLMLASLAPGILAMMPGLQLDLLLAVVPLVNVVLLARDLFEGTADPALAGVVILTTLVYAVAALALAARVFGSENVLYSEQSGWADLFRRPAEPRPTASVPAALWCLALILPLHTGLQALLPLLRPFGPLVLVLAIMTGSIVFFVVLPLIFTYLGHVVPRSGFALYRPRTAALLAGLLLGCSLWPLVLQLIAWMHTELPEQIKEQAAEALQSMRTLGPLAAVPVIVAAICEEFFFRGFLFQALRRVSGPVLTVGVTAALFGLTHAALGGALGLGQLVPSTLLGLVLGTVCWLSDSVWPGLVLHVCHNALNAALGQLGLVQEEAIPPAWLLGGALGSGIGLLLLAMWGRSRRVLST